MISFLTPAAGAVPKADLTVPRLLFLSLLVLTLTGCLTPKAHENPKTTQELQVALQDFHMKLRWGLWEQAAAYTADNYRNQFLGRYEELGDDYKIVKLEVKQVKLGDPISTVEVEQEWYVEPVMVVQKKRYIESWVFHSGMWRINERITKDEFRSREQGKSKLSPEPETTEPEATEPEATGPATPQDETAQPEAAPQETP